MPTRRALLALALLQTATAPMPTSMVRPMLLAGADGAELDLPAGGHFSCPSTRARLIGQFPLRTGSVCVVAFGCECDHGAQDVMALVAADGSLLAIERLVWRGQGGQFATIVAMLPDRAHLALKRHISTTSRPAQFESWTDYLSLEGAVLRDTPMRPVTVETFQFTLSAERQAIAAALKTGQHCVPNAVLQALRCTPFHLQPRVNACMATLAKNSDAAGRIASL